MKKEIPPAAIIAIIALLLVGVVAAILVSQNSAGEKVDIKTLSPEDLRDPDPPRGRRGDSAEPTGGR